MGIVQSWMDISMNLDKALVWQYGGQVWMVTSKTSLMDSGMESQQIKPFRPGKYILLLPLIHSLPGIETAIQQHFLFNQKLRKQNNFL